VGPTPPTPWKNKRSADKTRNRTSPGTANKKRVARKKRRSAVLLIDEADALFGKRSEVKDPHDR